MKRLILAVALILLASLPAGAQGLQPQAFVPGHVVLPQVALREGVTVDLSLTVFTNPERCQERTVFAVHGMLHTAAAWGPLAALLLAQPPGLAPCRILALDLPGHGRSSLPSGTLFGELTLDDYVTSVLASVARLQDLGLQPDTLMGHSLGAALVVLAQQRLKTQDSSLRRAYGVRQAVLLGAAVLNPIPQPQWDSGAALAPILAFTTETPEMGRYVAVPVPFWRAFMFLNLATPPQAPAGAPGVAEIVAQGYFGPVGSPVAPESRAMLDGMVPRPSADPGLFGPEAGTRLTMVAYEQDRVVKMDKALAYYAHLTGDQAGVRFVAVGGLDAVHDTHISDPGLLLAAAPWLITAF